MDDAASPPALTPREAPARTIPAPSTVSPELARSISAAALLPRDAMLRTPQTTDQWRGMIAANNAISLERQAGVKARFPSQIAEREVGGVLTRQVVPGNLDLANASRVLIHLHGGAYVINGGEAGLSEAILGAHYTRTRVLSVDYRMPPAAPFPAAVEDAVAVYKSVIRNHDPRAVGVFGTSAGGGLALAMVLKLKALSLPMPGALAPSTPWADLAGHSDSYATNAHIDGVLPHYEGVLEACARLYAGAAGLDDPLVSPVHGDFTGFPPSILTTGTRDILLSDTVRVYRAMRAAGVEARLEAHEAMSHAEFNSAYDSPESVEVFRDIAGFFDAHLAR
jgi:epsilon-lactone hydrolase